MLTATEWDVLRLSVVVAAWAMAIGLPIAFVTALILSRARIPGRRLLDAIVHAPLVLPPVVVGYLLLVVFGTRGPVGAWLLHHFGLRLVFDMKGAIVATLVMAFPLMVRAIRLSLDAIDPGLEDAARTLGARPLDVLFSVTLPLCAPGIVSGAVMGFARALGEFGATITFASNIEGQTRTLPLAIYTATQSVGGDETAMRLVLISMALAIGALVGSDALERAIRRSLGRHA